eukprot:Hpha_TRINITY_DN6799_c0_g1::TRINITY_DN6799_c0_g1_i1::g.110854::m.110854
MADLTWVLLGVGGGFLFLVLLGVLLWSLCFTDKLRVSIESAEDPEQPPALQPLHPPAVLPNGGKMTVGSSVTLVPPPGCKCYVRLGPVEGGLDAVPYELWSGGPIFIPQVGRWILQAFSTATGAADSVPTTAMYEVAPDEPPPSAVQFSHPGGEYPEDFCLTLWQADAHPVLYTIGRPGQVPDPYASPPAFVYSRPLLISGMEGAVEVKALPAGSPAPPQVMVYRVTKQLEPPVLTFMLPDGEEVEAGADVQDLHHNWKAAFRAVAGATVLYSLVRARKKAKGGQQGPCCTFSQPLEVAAGRWVLEALCTRHGWRDSELHKWELDVAKPPPPPPRSASTSVVKRRFEPPVPPKPTPGAICAELLPHTRVHTVGVDPFCVYARVNDRANCGGMDVFIEPPSAPSETVHVSPNAAATRGVEIELFHLGRLLVRAEPRPADPTAMHKLIAAELEYDLRPPPPRLVREKKRKKQAGGVRCTCSTPGWWSGPRWEVLVTLDGSTPYIGNPAAQLLPHGSLVTPQEGEPVLAVTAHTPYEDAPPEEIVISLPAELSEAASSSTTVAERTPRRPTPRRSTDPVPAPRAPPPRFSPKGRRHACERLPVRLHSTLAEGLVEIRWKRSYEGDDLQEGGGQLYLSSDPPVFTPADMGPMRTLTLKAVARAPSLGLGVSEEVAATYEIVRPPRPAVSAASEAAAAAGILVILAGTHRPDPPPPPPRLTCHAADMSVCMIAEGEAWYTFNGGDPRPGAGQGEEVLRAGAAVRIPHEGTTVLRARTIVREEGGRVVGMSPAVQRVFAEGLVPAAHTPAPDPAPLPLAAPFGSPAPGPPVFVAHARAVVVVAICDAVRATVRYTFDGTRVGPASAVLPLGGLQVPVSATRRNVELRIAAHVGRAWSTEVVHLFEYREGAAPQWAAEAAARAAAESAEAEQT